MTHAIVKYPQPDKLSMMKTDDFRFESVEVVATGTLQKGNIKADNGYTCRIFKADDGAEYQVFNIDWSAKKI